MHNIILLHINLHVCYHMIQCTTMVTMSTATSRMIPADCEIDKSNSLLAKVPNQSSVFLSLITSYALMLCIINIKHVPMPGL